MQPRTGDQAGAQQDDGDARHRERPDRLIEKQPVKRQRHRRVGVEQQDGDAGLEGLEALPEAQGLRRAEGRAEQKDAPRAAAPGRTQIDAHGLRARDQRHQCQRIAPEQHRRRAEPVGIEDPRHQWHHPHHPAAANRGDGRRPHARGLGLRRHRGRVSVAFCRVPARRCYGTIQRASVSEAGIAKRRARGPRPSGFNSICTHIRCGK